MGWFDLIRRMVNVLCEIWAGIASALALRLLPFFSRARLARFALRSGVMQGNTDWLRLNVAICLG